MTREQIIDWILTMRKTDETYARSALRWYADLLPHLDLSNGVRDAMKAAA